MGTAQEVCCAVDRQSAPVKKPSLDVDTGRVCSLRRSDISYVARLAIDAGDDQRFERSLVDVSELSVPHGQNVDLERVNGLYRLLPTLFVDRHLALLLFPYVLEVDVDLRRLYGEITDETGMQERAPMNA